MAKFIPCQCCGKEYTNTWSWFVCDKCNYRVCMPCLTRHKGKYGSGYKCSQCMMGWMKGPRQV
jgi:hypothetical protein